MTLFERQQGFSLLDVLAALGVIAIVSAMALPMTDNTVRGFRFKGDGQALANMVKLAKMRAAARYTRTRVYADFAANAFRLQVWDKGGGAWVDEGAEKRLSTGVTFGFGGLASPPSDTQDAIAQSPPCTVGLAGGGDIAQTACIVFNSRGIPIGPLGPVGGNAVYITNGVGVFGTTVTATPLVRLWWSPAQQANWVKQ